jgi:hypothetical protein
LANPAPNVAPANNAQGPGAQMIQVGIQRETRKCFACKEMGHIAQDCPHNPRALIERLLDDAAAAVDLGDGTQAALLLGQVELAHHNLAQHEL